MRKLTLVLLILSSMVVNGQCKYNIFTAKYGLNRDLGLTVGTLHPNNWYDGIQGTMLGKVFYMNLEKGYNIAQTKHIGCLAMGILGLHSSDNYRYLKLNYGASMLIFTRGITLGLSYTNNENLTLRLGFYISSYP